MKFPTCNSTITPVITIDTTNSYMKVCSYANLANALFTLEPIAQTNRPSAPGEKGDARSSTKTLGFRSNPNSKKHQYIFVIPVNRQIIVNFPLPPRDFFQFRFSRKNIVSKSVFCIMFIILPLYLNTHALICGMNRSSDHSQ